MEQFQRFEINNPYVPQLRARSLSDKPFRDREIPVELFDGIAGHAPLRRAAMVVFFL